MFDTTMAPSADLPAPSGVAAERSPGRRGGSGTERLVTVAEVAQRMRVSKMTVYRLIHAGDLPALRVGRSFRVPEDAVGEYLASSYVTS